MVPFAGYSMPLSYGDVGQVFTEPNNHSFRGTSVTQFLEWLTPSSLAQLKPYSSTLSVLLNPQGGIIDDTIVTKHSEKAFYVVTNAGRRKEDLAWFAQKLEEWNAGKSAEEAVEHEVLENWGLLALQGPEAASYLQSLTPFDLKQLTFGTSAFVPIEGFNLHVARGGYTGEDGFEISIPPSQTVEVATMLLKPPVQLIGLGARDSLRLEAGMCLYGNDLDETTTPVEAGLSWVIGKDRKVDGGFIGADIIQKQLKEGPTRRRVGLVVEGAPARRVVTSGIPSPTLGKNIAMGYIQSGWHKKGTEVEVEVRKQRRKAILTPMPFVKPNYWRG
ncbi:putative aminomethyltransferase, mitochondrial [Psilocybe cubensis]|uniref:Aminomethyltransferase, mitochondrial n=2 Tax=Psilocybe cubensis TaxID=181762 RepID=A0ACB8GU75_PSICU|nr:putative aminomethyltransferase, mitochondrial [Psilocybe cubensis]KAH9479139.1 putative aminomethyltransferase, mitochondrial [Psilocybe cubensis]